MVVIDGAALALRRGRDEHLFDDFRHARGARPHGTRERVAPQSPKAHELASRITDEPRRDIRIYLDSGWPHDNFEVTLDMRARLLHSGYVEGRDLMYLAHPGASHSESAWTERLHLPLQFFFAERPNARSRAGGAVVEPTGV